MGIVAHHMLGRLQAQGLRARQGVRAHPRARVAAHAIDPVGVRGHGMHFLQAAELLGCAVWRAPPSSADWRCRRARDAGLNSCSSVALSCNTPARSATDGHLFVDLEQDLTEYALYMEKENMQ